MSDTPKRRTVAVDTMILQWVIREEGPLDKRERARYLFEQLDREHAQIILPSVVVAEFIAPIRPEDRPGVVASLNERFLIEPFDIKDTITAAQLWDYGQAHRKKGVAGSRVALRSDILIIATAVGHGATEFYTDDDDCFVLAKKVKGMTARRLPPVDDLFYGAGDGSIEQTEAQTQPGPEAPQG